MKSLDEVLSSFKSQAFDGRDLNRLTTFMTVEQIEAKGLAFESKEAKDNHKPREWTRENILERLEADVEFAFEKALNMRGLSSSMMFEVVKMWNNILDEGLQDWPDGNYAMYGLPLFKATAVKYGFPNPIGDDDGDEAHYDENY